MGYAHFVPRLGRHLDAYERDDERGDVAQHVERIGDQRHRVGHVADDDLDEEEGAGEPEHGHQAALLARVTTHGGSG